MSENSRNGTCYEVHGRDAGETLLFIHGLGLNRQIWQDYIPSFTDNYRVISYDLFGHGESSAPPRKPDLTVYSEQIVDLLDELSIQRVALIGFSLGGMINRRMAMDHGDRVSALAILNSPHERGEEAQKLVEQRATDTAAGGPGATLDSTIERWFTTAYRQANSEYIQQVRDWVLANDPALYADCRWVLANGVVELIRPSNPVNHPTLVMTCEHDSGSTPKMAHDIAGEIIGAETIIVPELQHMGLAEQPDFFIAPIKLFLEKNI